MSKLKIETYERYLTEASGRYELPPYSSERHRDFVVNLYRKGHEIRHYNGRNFYRGPAVVVDRAGVEQAKADAGVVCVIDHLGHDFILYPVE